MKPSRESAAGRCSNLIILLCTFASAVYARQPARSTSLPSSFSIPGFTLGFVVLYQLITWVSVQGIHIRKFIMQSYPITATFFAERMRGVSVEVSERLQRRWREVGLLDEHGFSNTMDGEALG